MSENIVGENVSGASSSAALEAVKELFNGDGPTKKGRRGQNEVLLLALS